MNRSFSSIACVFFFDGRTDNLPPNLRRFWLGKSNPSSIGVMQVFTAELLELDITDSVTLQPVNLRAEFDEPPLGDWEACGLDRPPGLLAIAFTSA